MSERPERGSWKAVLDATAMISMIVASIVLIVIALNTRADARGPSKTALKTPVNPVSIVGAPSKGEQGAKVTMIEFADFQCPFCAKFAKDTLAQIDREFVATGKVRLVFRNYPLNIHPFAQPAAAAALCAGQQSQFWAMHDLLFQNPSLLDADSLRQDALRLHLNIQAFQDCIGSPATAEEIETDASTAKSLGVGGTPAFLVGITLPDATVRGIEWVGGSLPFTEFKKVIDKTLDLADSRKAHRT